MFLRGDARRLHVRRRFRLGRGLAVLGRWPRRPAPAARPPHHLRRARPRRRRAPGGHRDRPDQDRPRRGSPPRRRRRASRGSPPCRGHCCCRWRLSSARLDEQACDAALLDLPHRVQKHLATFRHRAADGAGVDGLVPVEITDPERSCPADRGFAPAGQPGPDEPRSADGGDRADGAPDRRNPPGPALLGRLIRREPSLPPQLGELPGAAAGHHPGPASRTSARGRYSSKTPSPL